MRPLAWFCIALLALTLRVRGAGGDDEPGQAPLRGAATARDLVAQWQTTSFPSPALRCQVVRRLSEVVPVALQGAAAAPDDKRLLALLGTLRESWHRQQVPDGMVYVPAGALELPTQRANAWGPSGERIEVAAFYIDRTEVTQQAWSAWQEAQRAAQGESERAPSAQGGSEGSLPITRVSWAEADDYARRARGGRLPQLEQYERALRGSSISTWPWGSGDPRTHANLDGHASGGVLPVGSLPEGASPFGVLDLVGNVAEWSDTSFSWGRVGRHHVVFGGSYADEPDPRRLWRARGRAPAPVGDEERRPWLGLRVVVLPPGLPGE